MRRVRYLLLGVLIAVTLTAAACSSSNKASTSADTASIVIKNKTFTVSAAKAGVITIRNDDGFGHTVTADDGSFDVSVAGGTTATITVAKPGSYPFHCNIHSSMKATLVVT